MPERKIGSRGMTIGELLLTTLVLSVAAIGVVGLIDFGTRESGNVLHRESQSAVVAKTADYLLTSMGAMKIGAVADDPAECTACHMDTDGSLADNPASRCPADMTVPAPPLDVEILDFDPASGAAVATGDIGNGIRFRGDVEPSPATTKHAAIEEVRTIRPVVDPAGEGWRLVEEVDHDLDGTAEIIQPVAYGIGSISFRLVRRPGPAWEPGARVSESCSSVACHGTGGAGGRDIVGSGFFVPGTPDANGAPGAAGEVWQGLHPRTQGAVGVELRVQANTPLGRDADADGSRGVKPAGETLTGFALPSAR